jgi:hypothetical protein
LTKVRPSTSAAHVIQFVGAEFANFVVRIGHVIPLLVWGETIPAKRRLRDAVRLLCDIRHIQIRLGLTAAHAEAAN